MTLMLRLRMLMGVLALIALGSFAQAQPQTQAQAQTQTQTQTQPPDPGPQLRATARMATDTPLTVGGTATLQVDVLTSTWFTQPPELPPLNIPGAMVTGPTGDATLIRDTIDGVPYSGLRFAYLISPTTAGALQVPAMSIRAQVGQAKAPLSTQTQPLDVQASGPPAGEAGSGHLLAATAVQLTQQIQYSAQTPSVGDHISRVITVQAQGAQAMLIPPPASPDVPGLKAYRSEPVLTQLSDSRGGFLGGQRVDRIDYVVERAGAYALPDVELPWWNLTTNKADRAVLPEQRFEAKAGAAYQTPFSIQQDLRDLGRQVQVRIPGGWLLVAAGLIVVALAVWLGRPSWRRITGWTRERALALRARWQASEPYAARAMRRELAQPHGRLNALYHWLRLSRRSVSIADATASLSPDLHNGAAAAMRDCYGATPNPARGLQALRQTIPRWRKAFRADVAQARQEDLLPLNPRKIDRPSGEHR